MNLKNNGIDEAGLRFFGKMTASISHEIKNVLAIISEHAGILEDLASMQSSKGIPLDPEKVGSVSKKIAIQIQRADSIIKKMNKFAHSVDQPTANVDVCEIISLMTALSERLVANKGVKMDPRPCDRAAIIRTHPFYLENLLWHCIARAMDFSGKEMEIGIAVEGTESGAVIRFTGLSRLAEIRPDEFSEKDCRVLLEALNASISVEVESEEVSLTLPAEINRSD